MRKPRLVCTNKSIIENYEIFNDKWGVSKITYEYKKVCPKEMLTISFNGKDNVTGHLYPIEGGTKLDILGECDPIITGQEGEKHEEFKRRFRQLNSELSDKVQLSPESKKLWDAGIRIVSL